MGGESRVGIGVSVGIRNRISGATVQFPGGVSVKDFLAFMVSNSRETSGDGRAFMVSLTLLKYFCPKLIIPIAFRFYRKARPRSVLAMPSGCRLAPSENMAQKFETERFEAPRAVR